MAKQTDATTKDKDRKRRERFYRFVAPPLGVWLGLKLGYSWDKSFEPDDIDGPLIVCINHACAYDPLCVSAAFKRRPLTFIASEHMIRDPKWGNFFSKYLSLIPHQKGKNANRTALAAIKRVRRGESVFLAPEGEQTWDGLPMPLRASTAGLIRSCRATLVTYMIEGGYLAQPRWAYSTRKGRVYGHPVKVYSPEMLEGMTDEEIEKAITDDLDFDVWKWQKSQPGGPVRYRCSRGGNAEGLERAVCSCPECRRIGSLRTSGDSISCSCGFSLKLEDTGFFEQPGPFETVADWEEADRSILASILETEMRAAGPASGSEDEPARGDASEIFGDDDITLSEIEQGHSSREAARGRLSLSCEGDGFVLGIGDFRFRFGDIEEMMMVLAGRILFSTEDGYFELFSKKANMRKYVTARELAMASGHGEES
ncbi:MAG: 1-acyl-sn-glycerol-3-phosphate acyltransferase [Mogibacterium sp.]|nr:1-acyl-sn-glycerol-3-phosphate acyltransferase [Mogibacterium sp.]